MPASGGHGLEQSVNSKRKVGPFGQKLTVIVAATLLSAATALIAQAATVSVTHAGGQTAVPPNPQKTVVLDLALLDVMDALKVPVAGVPDGRFSGALSHYGQDSVTKVGSMFEPD